MSKIESLELKDKRWLSPDEVEEVYGLKTAYQAKLRMKVANGIPFSKVGRVIKYDRHELVPHPQINPKHSIIAQKNEI